MKKKIYYWANDIDKNSGEGILARKFLILMREKHPKIELVQINTFKRKNSFFFKYITPFIGLIYLHLYNLKGYKTSYINYLPIWNFILILFLPKKTLLGPITGSDVKQGNLYFFLKMLGIFILKKKYKTLLFSHRQFEKYFKNNKGYYFYNFLLYNFVSNNSPIKKKFDIIFYLRKHKNKGNKFLIDLINYLSHRYKISILGEDVANIKKSKNVYIHKKVSRKKAQIIISESKCAVGTKENLFSFFVIDCLRAGLKIFYNKDFQIDKNISSNLLSPIHFKEIDKSIDIIENNLKRNLKKFIKIKKINYIKYLDYCKF